MKSNTPNLKIVYDQTITLEEYRRREAAGLPIPNRDRGGPQLRSKHTPSPKGAA